MLSVVLVEPQTPGNVGSVARVMKNFGVRKLLLVNPKCDHLDGEAYGRAMHAFPILKGAEIISDFRSLERFDILVGTTAILGSPFSVPRSPISPAELASLFPRKSGNIALVFGRESNGLTNAQLSRCDVIVTVPTSGRYPALNLSHAVAIVLYELFKSSSNIRSRLPLASRREKKLALSMVGRIIAAMDLRLESKRKTQSLVWSRLINKSFLTKREAYALLGFLRKVTNLIRK